MLEWAEVSEFVDECVSRAPVLSDLGRRPLELHEVQSLARRHHAEVRTFIDLKLPSRMRICPPHAHKAKNFFSELYVEEQGHFEPGANHADTFKRFCLGIGLTEQQLEDEYQGYWPNFSYLLSAQPSMEMLVHELAVSYAWESCIPRIAGSLTNAVESVAQKLNLTADQTSYFTDHIELDQHHAKLAYDVLEIYVTTPELKETAYNAIEETLVTRNPWTVPHLT